MSTTTTTRPRRTWTGLVRRLVPFLLLPLAVLGAGLANAPWLRAFPESVIAVPLFGAALIAGLLPVLLNGIGLRRLWMTTGIEALLLAFYELLVVLRSLTDVSGLWDGLVHGPSQVLSFALPLVDPRTLLVAPIALCWVSAALVGECIARGWQTVLPYLTLLVVFGVCYAATARAIANAGDGRRYDTLLAAGLLLTLLLLRATQAWIAEDDGAATTQPDGVLPLRGLATGAALAVVIAVATAAVAQTNVFHGPPRTPRIVPPLQRSTPLTPIAFISGLRPVDPSSAGAPLFTVNVDRAASNYISVANLDTYDGDSWSFQRTFPPSGGVIPPDRVQTLRPAGPLVTQQYSIKRGPMTGVPWMPYLQRPQKVSGLAIDVDADSGMITPAQPLQADQTYAVRSASSPTVLQSVKKGATFDGAANSGVPPQISDPLSKLVTTLVRETHVSSGAGVAFLRAVTKQLQRTSGLARGRPTTAASATTASGSAAASGGTESVSSGTSFADVLTSIRINHAATPEQFATLMCLIARAVGVPARIATGFRVGTSALPADSTTTVLTSEAWTWVEIPISGAGWVVLDPSPRRIGRPAPQQNQTAQPSSPAASAPPTDVLGTPAGGASAPVAPNSRVPHDSRLRVTLLEVVLVVLAVLIIVLIAMLLLRKRIRARRRRAGDPRRSLLGAWQESLDVLQEAGLPDLSAATSREVSTATQERFGGEPAAQARYLGDAANAAIFDPTAWVDSTKAEDAWRAHVVLRTSLRRRLSFTERMGAGLRYHRTRPPVGVTSPASWMLAMRERAAAARAQGRHGGPGPRRRGRH